MGQNYRNDGITQIYHWCIKTFGSQNTLFTNFQQSYTIIAEFLMQFNF